MSKTCRFCAYSSYRRNNATTPERELICIYGVRIGEIDKAKTVKPTDYCENFEYEPQYNQS